MWLYRQRSIRQHLVGHIKYKKARFVGLSFCGVSVSTTVSSVGELMANDVFRFAA